MNVFCFSVIIYFKLPFTPISAIWYTLEHVKKIRKKQVMLQQWKFGKY